MQRNDVKHEVQFVRENPPEESRRLKAADAFFSPTTLSVFSSTSYHHIDIRQAYLRYSIIVLAPLSPDFGTPAHTRACSLG